jgi:hypothetical protein
MYLVEDGLKEALITVRKKMKNYRTLYESNEEAVRTQVIEVILEALGWDPRNPEMVRPNKQTGEGIPDYALYIQDEIVLFMEAKNLSVNLKGAAQDQLTEYVYRQGVNFGVLTNGAIWMLVSAFEKGVNWADRVVWSIDILEGEPEDSIRYLKQISRSMMPNLEKIRAYMSAFDTTWESILENPELIVKGLTPIITNEIKQSHPNIEFDIDDLQEFLFDRVTELIEPGDIQLISGEPAPIYIATKSISEMTIDGTKFPVTKSKEVLIFTANWLIQKRKLARSNCPIPLGPKRYLVSVSPMHPSGKEFVSPRELSGGLYLETNLSTKDCIKHSKRLLEICGVDPRKLSVG